MAALIVALFFILKYNFSDPDQGNLLLLTFVGFLFIIHFLFIYFIGGYILKGVFFPYSNFFITQRLNSQINRRFAEEFGRLIMLMFRSIEIMVQYKQVETYE